MKQDVSQQIERVAVDALIPYARNSRTHSEAQIAQIAGSIREFGFTNPVLIDADCGIIAGHGRVLAAQKLGISDVPCIRLAHLTEIQRQAYIIADNKLALNAGWDDEMLENGLSDLHAASFDMALLGFTPDELSLAMGITADLDGAATDAGIDYKENYSIIVTCTGEENQQESFERLTGMGFECKVLVN